MLPDDVQVISVDDHVIEHERVWRDRLPARYLEAGPRIVELDGGQQAWSFEGRTIPTIGLNAVAGKHPRDFGVDPVRFDEMLTGCYDVSARLADMDLDGVHAQMCFPSFPGFAGGTLFAAEDKDLATACVVAWNDFILDEWCAAAPDRFIPMVMVPFWDVAASVVEVERTAAKGAKSITFSEAPHRLGLPSYHSDHWDPFLAAAQAADMPLCLHFGTGGAPATASDANFAVAVALFGMNSQSTTVDMLLSPVFHKFPRLRVALSEGGIGWIPYVLERVDYTWERHRWYTGVNTEVRPSDLFHAHMFGCFIADNAGIEERALIGTDNIMFEGDYPHSDSNFPASRKKLADVLDDVNDHEARMIAEDNARRVFNFPRGSRDGIMTGPFEGVRVLEVASWTFVPAAGAAMADLGADVIKVEPPNGDPQRGLMNLLGRPDGSGPNPFVEIPNRGKRGMTIDLTTAQGRDVLLELATTADVFLTSYLPAVRKRLRIELDDLRGANPQIIYTCGHGWGARGPMKDTGGFDLAAGWASAGMASKMTRPGQEPMFQPAAFFDLQGANTIAGAIGTALFQRERTGVPTEVDVSLLGVGIWTLSPDIMAGPFVGSVPAPDRTRAPNPLTNSYPTSDGRWLYLVCLQADRFWAELCAAIGRPELVSDERYADMVVRAQNAEACVTELERTFVSESLEHWRKQLADFTGVWSPALTPVEVHDHVQVEANGYLPEVVANDGATFRLPAPPMQFGGVSPVPANPAPELGQHTEEILLELGRDWDAINELRQSGALG